MANEAAVPRKYIMGWLRFRPGKREEFLVIYQRGAEATRKEPGCVFYDYGVSPTDPDLMYLLECFASEEAHAEHLDPAPVGGNRTGTQPDDEGGLAPGAGGGGADRHRER